MPDFWGQQTDAMLIKPGSPFYKNPTLWLIILLPLSTVIVGIAFLIFSITHYDGVVEDDYYMKGKQINQTIERDELASQYNLSAEVMLDNEKNLLYMTIDSLHDFQHPEEIELKFIHRTVSTQDVGVRLIKELDNRYFAVLPELSESRWQVELGTIDWRLKGQVTYPEQIQFSLTSKENAE